MPRWHLAGIVFELHTRIVSDLYERPEREHTASSVATVQARYAESHNNDYSSALLVVALIVAVVVAVMTAFGVEAHGVRFGERRDRDQALRPAA